MNSYRGIKYPIRKSDCIFRNSGCPDSLQSGPVETIPSMMSLQESVQTNMHGKKRMDENRDRYFRNLYELSLHYYRTLEQTYAACKDHPDYLFIAHDELKINFESVLSKIVTHAEIPWDEKLSESIKTQAKVQAEFSSSHQYSPEKFGFSAEEIRKDIPFYSHFLEEIRLKA